MSVEDFLKWFEGFKEGIECKGDTTITSKQWNIIKTKISEIKKPSRTLDNEYRQWLTDKNPYTNPSDSYKWVVTSNPSDSYFNEFKKEDNNDLKVDAVQKAIDRAGKRSW